jgi:CheY-like chemotaxis protein
MTAKLLETFTKKGNYEYGTAENGLLALQACESARRIYDIILMGQQEYIPKLYNILTKKTDISMPVMNGMDSARGIRKLEHERGQKPATIVALTGLASASVRQEAFSNGINVFMTKPVSFSVLRKFLNDWTPETELQTSMPLCGQDHRWTK